MFISIKRFGIVFSLILCSLGWSISFAAEKADKAKKAPFNFEEASKNVPKPRELWPAASKHLIPSEFKVLSDRLIPSDTDPSVKIREVNARFFSQEIGEGKWVHKCKILLPENYKKTVSPEDLGKVVIVGTGGLDYNLHTTKIADPIVVRFGIPVMVLANPGCYEDGRDLEGRIVVVSKLRRETGELHYNLNCQVAVVFVRAMDEFQKFLGLKTLKAVVGGHSKRGRGAVVAAAFDSRVVSPIIMGNEGVHKTDRIQSHLPFHYPFFQEQVNVPVFYIGATNEGGYKMFNINLLQERLKRKMTVEMVPNYVHGAMNEIQFMDFIMWTAHIHKGRPIPKISDITHTRKGRRSVFRAKIDTKSKIQAVNAWYVYSDDDLWRDLMWYHLLMKPTKDGYYEAVFHGTLPDAFMIEVGDIAKGVPGYVSSVPHKLTDKPVKERVPGDWRSRNWKP